MGVFFLVSLYLHLYLSSGYISEQNDPIQVLRRKGKEKEFGMQNITYNLRN